MTSRKPDPPTDAELEEFYAGMSPVCAAVARRFPMTTCYTLGADGGHYWIYSYTVDSRDPSVPPTLRLIHGADSFNPGTVVFGADPDELVRCDCGKWEYPSDEQLAAFNAYAETLHPERGKYRVDNRKKRR